MTNRTKLAALVFIASALVGILLLGNPWLVWLDTILAAILAGIRIMLLGDSDEQD